MLFAMSLAELWPAIVLVCCPAGFRRSVRFWSVYEVVQMTRRTNVNVIGGAVAAHSTLSTKQGNTMREALEASQNEKNGFGMQTRIFDRSGFQGSTPLPSSHAGWLSPLFSRPYTAWPFVTSPSARRAARSAI